MAEEQPTSADPDPTEGRVFLVVDDDPMVRKIVGRGLSQLKPAEVIEEEDGLAAQEVLRQRKVDVVVTDVVMPNMDGLALMKWAQEHCPDPLWIVLSGLDTFDAAVEALQLGAFDYLAKPPEVPRVRVAVRNALDQIELKRERERLYGELENSNEQLAEKVAQLQTVCRVLEDQAATIQADLDRAEVIQRALLPQQPPAMRGWCIETLYRPGSSVGGDFYDAVILGDDHLGLVMADAAGHGVAAAMLSVLFKLRLRHVDGRGNILDPMQVMHQLNKSLFEMLATPGVFITATYILIDLHSGQGWYASAGHPPCVITAAADGSSRTLTRTGPALGLEAEPRYSQHDFELHRGDRLILYTDGVIEGGPDCPDIEDLGARMHAVGDRAQLLGGIFADAIRDFPGDRDDIAIVLLERSEGESHFDDAAPLKNQAQDTPVMPATELPPDQPHIAAGVMERCAYVAIVGSVTWLCAHALLNSSIALLEGNDELVLDLARCEGMDSTCLGTLHEIVVSNPTAVQLQGVGTVVRNLFDELSMEVVLKHISDTSRTLPEPMSVIETTSLSPAQQGARILRAHETLAELSDANQEQFRAVVDSLRADLPD